MASIDLKDAYYTVPIFHAHQKYLKFIFNSILYQYTRMANACILVKYHSLESDKIQALKINKGIHKSHMQLTSSSIADLKWWIANMPTVQRDIVRPNPSMIIQTDASKKKARGQPLAIRK